MTTALMPPPHQRFYTNAGQPAAGYLLYTYAAGTMTPKNTFTDSAGVTPHTNPLVLDAKGEAVIHWDTGAYRVDLRSPVGVQVTGFPVDNFEAPIMPATLADPAGGGLVGFDYARAYSTGTMARFMQDLSQNAGAEFIGIASPAAGAVKRTIAAKLLDVRPSVTDFGAKGDGATNDTAKFTLTRNAASGGAYHIPNGTYVLDAVPDVFADNFTAGSNVILKVAGIDYTVSGAFSGGLRYQRSSSTKVNILDAKTGNVVMYLQDGGPGTATGFYRGLAITTDSHAIQMQPATNGGSSDLLWQRSTLNADPGGNRYNITFNEPIDRLDFSHATTAGGFPSFDSYMQVVGGLTPSLSFPAIQATFNAGWGVKQRAAGGFHMKLEPFSSLVTKLQQVGGSGTEFIRFADNSMGFFGAAGGSRPTITGSRGGNVALANTLANLAALGLVTDATTA